MKTLKVNYDWKKQENELPRKIRNKSKERNTKKIKKNWRKKSKINFRKNNKKRFLECKDKTAQINELWCKILCHNLTVVIQEISELGIKGEFVVER